MIINMGPQHPSTHGVLRLMLELQGETVLRCKPIIGYLHTGMEKTGEKLTYMQGGTNVTRMDYVSPLNNELVFSMATEKLLGIDDDIPERAVWMRMLLSELNRMSSHLLFLATNGMDLGAVSMMIYGWREREEVLRFFQKVTGLRMNHNFIRPGGVAADLPAGWRDDVLRLLDLIPPRLEEYDTLDDRSADLARAVAGRRCDHRPGGDRARRDRADPAQHRDAGGISAATCRICTTPRSSSTSSSARTATAFDRYAIRLNEVRESMKIVRQILDRMPGGDYRIQDKKVTPPPRARIDESMEALIHHFKIFTEGFKVPEGEVYVAIESPRGEIGCYIASDGSATPYRMHVRAPRFVNIQCLPHMMRGGLDRRRGRRHLQRRPRPRRGRSLMARLDRGQRRVREGDHRALPEGSLGDDSAAAPRPAAGRLRHQRGDQAHRRTGRGDVGRDPRHGDVLRDVQVRAGRQVPHQHLQHDVVRVDGRRRADAPRRAQARHQGRQHDPRRPVHAGARRVPGGLHRGAVPAGQLPLPVPRHDRRPRHADRRSAERSTRRRDPAARHGRPGPPAHPVRARRRRVRARRCHHRAGVDARPTEARRQ